MCSIPNIFLESFDAHGCNTNFYVLDMRFDTIIILKLLVLYKIVREKTEEKNRERAGER